jgi:hypothetical protein
LFDVRIKILVLLLATSITGVCQNNYYKGQILDIKNNTPISNAYIVLGNGEFTNSDSLGFFRIKISSLPITVELSHMAYDNKFYSLTKIPNRIQILSLETKTNEIDHVSVFANDLVKLTQHIDFSIGGFEFDENNLWMIGYQNNRSSLSRLILAMPKILHLVCVKLFLS